MKNGFKFAIGVMLAIVAVYVLLFGISWVVGNWNTTTTVLGKIVSYGVGILILVGIYEILAPIGRKFNNWLSNASTWEITKKFLLFGLVPILLIISIYLGWYLISRKAKPLMYQTSLPSPTVIPIPTSIHRGYISVNFPVTLLSTSYSLDSPYPTYTPNATMSVPSSLSGSLGAYWLAGKVVFGPKYWAGDAVVGGDGTSSIQLRPAEHQFSGESIIIQNIPACAYCMYITAAPFFPVAKLKLEQEYDPPYTYESIPTNMKITRLSPTLIKFTIPIPQKGLVTNGVAYYDGFDLKKDPSGFIRIDITLPSSQSELTNFLLNNYIEQKKLR